MQILSYHLDYIHIVINLRYRRKGVGKIQMGHKRPAVHLWNPIMLDNISKAYSGKQKIDDRWVVIYSLVGRFVVLACKIEKLLSENTVRQSIEKCLVTLNFSINLIIQSIMFIRSKVGMYI